MRNEDRAVSVSASSDCEAVDSVRSLSSALRRVRSRPVGSDLSSLLRRRRLERSLSSPSDSDAVESADLSWSSDARVDPIRSVMARPLWRVRSVARPSASATRSERLRSAADRRSASPSRSTRIGSTVRSRSDDEVLSRSLAVFVVRSLDGHVERPDLRRAARSAADVDAWVLPPRSVLNADRRESLSLEPDGEIR